MITYIHGNMFDSEASILTNPVNCVGVMGKGLALEFKNRFHNLFKDYRTLCQNGQLSVGKPYLWKSQVLLFPTKRDWKHPSKIEYIEDGLKYLVSYLEIDDLVAFPALGCGLGGLDWREVKPLMHEYLHDCCFDVIVYEP